MRILCPQCSSAIEFPEEDPPGELVCSSCQQRFLRTPGETVISLRAANEDTLTYVSARGIASAGPSQALGDYEILGEIARGGMGIVYKARQKRLNRIVALKMIKAGELADEQTIQRFAGEARAAARLDHPHIVPVYEVGEQDGRHYFSMGYVSGVSLAQRLKDGPLPPRGAAELVQTIAAAVAYAHGQGIIHRDLKPSNILLEVAPGDEPTSRGSATPELRPRITDFGLAKQMESDSELTATGQVLGTPGYMSPEQAAGRAGEVGVPSDVYSVGAILYHVLTGRPPFQAANVVETLRQVQEREPVSPRALNPDVDRDLETICLICLEKAPLKRYGSAQMVVDELGRFLEGRPITARPVGRTERLWRWCRRRPDVAIPTAAAIGLLLLGSVISSVFAYRAGVNADRFRAASRLSDQRWYGAEMNHIQHLVESGQIAAALELLDSLRPERTGGIDLRGWEWHYLKRRCHSELARLDLAGGRATAVAFSPVAPWLAAGDESGAVLVWDVNARAIVHELTGHTGRINAVAFSPDGTRCASASEDSSVRIWDTTTGRQLLVYENHGLGVKGLAFRPEVSEICTAGEDCTIRFWSAESGIDRLVIQTHLDAPLIRHMTLSPDGDQVAVAFGADGCRIWDTRTGELTRQFAEPASWLVFNGDGDSLVLAGGGAPLRLCDLASGEVSVLGGRNSFDAIAVFSPDGRQLAAADQREGMLTVWDLESRQPLRTLAGHLDGVYDLAFDAGGTQLASASADGTVRVWDTGQDQEYRSLAGHQSNVMCIDVSSDGRLLVTGSGDQSARIWNLATGQVVHTLGRHEVESEPPRGDRPGRPIRISTYSGHSGFVAGAAFGPDDQRITTAAWDGTIRVWDVKTGEERLELNHGLQNVRGLVWRPASDQVVLFDWQNDPEVWDVVRKVRVLTIPAGAHVVRDAAFHPDGGVLATAGEDHNVRLWDPETAQELGTLSGHSDVVLSVAFSADGSRLASGGRDRTVRVWNLTTDGMPSSTSASSWVVIRGHSGDVDGVAFTPDGRRLATVGGTVTDLALKIWDLSTGQELLSFPGQHAPVKFTPDGDGLICSSGPWQTVRVLSAAPVDAQPYRVEPFRPATRLPSTIPAGASGDTSAERAQLKVLGYYTARQLPLQFVKDGGEPVASLKREDTDFLVVVVSVPHRCLVPSEAEYADLKSRWTGTEDEPRLQSREQMSIESHERFRFVRHDGATLPAVLYTHWPLQTPSPGFLSRSLTITHHAPVSPDARRLLAVAWVVRAADIEQPFQVQVNDEEPRPVPELRLAAANPH